MPTGQKGLPRPKDREEWFWARVVKSEGCWEWLGGHDAGGYSRVDWEGKRTLAHRIAFLLTGGVIPDGTEADHLCRNHGCVRPSHLEFVPHAENVRRGLAPTLGGLRQTTKTHCPQGHEYNEANTQWRRIPCGSGWGRNCRECDRLRHMERRRRRVGV